MNGLYGMTGKLGGTGVIVFVLGVVVAVATTASAGPRYFVKPDGTRVELERSDAEFAVEFRDVNSVRGGAKRLASKGIAVVDEDTEPAPNVRILRVAEASRKRRDSIMTDPGVVEVRPVYYMPDVSYPFLATGTILVRVTDDLTVAEVVGLWDDYHLDFVEPVDGLPGVYCVKTKSIDEDEVFRAQVMSNDDRVVWAQPNMRSPVILHQAQQEVTPSDPLFGRQWHLDNTGQDGGTAEADISARAAWTISGGSDVLIGGFDDGCDVNHEDLDQNYLGIGHDPTLLSTNSDSNNPEPKQIGDRHGTAVMGLAVSVGNLEGGRGVSFLSRFTLSRGASEFTTPQQKASVYTFARQQNVDVHINSWGLDEDEPIPSVLEEAINVAFEDGRDPDGEAGSQPPRGMVIVFAAGNLEDGQDNEELPTGQVLATLNSVIGVGASTNNDTLADYSRFGPGIEFLAPGGSEEFGILTTDNDDDNIVVDDGYNIAGFDADGEADVDGEGLYTEEFLGTSASCPIAAGVAALVLSENPALSATAVRTTLEHTCDRVSPADADYDNITGRSLLYGYGRVNAFKAVQAARDASENGGLTWPGGVSNLVTAEDDMSWDSGSGTREFMVIESTGDFAFDFNADNPFPVDGVCYSEEQLGCDSAAIEDLPNGVSLTAITGCAGSNCGNGEDVLLENMVQQGNSYAVYARSAIGRYSWGVLATTEDTDPVDDQPTDPRGPKVIIAASITEGESPLTVQFFGNAERTDADVDVSRAQWDFDIDDGVTVNATTRNATYTYEVNSNESRTFIAQLTMYDVNDVPGVAQIAIRVDGSGVGDVPNTGSSNVRITVGIPGSVDSDVSSGFSPFEVLLSVDATTIIGELVSVEWDLGDGGTSTSLVVPHTYTNTNETELRIPITARITTRTSLASTQTTTAERVVTVFPGVEQEEEEEPQPIDGVGVPGLTGSGTCGIIGMMPLILMFGAMGAWRRRHN